MNLALSKTQLWLPVLISLLAGMLFATVLCGQEISTEQIEVESILMPPSELECASCAGQVVMTNRSRRRIEPVEICPGDDVWLINARDSDCSPSDLSRLQCSRLECGSWIPAELEELVELHATDKTKVTMLYVHGNRTSLKWATSRGLQFYKYSFQTEKRPPIRFVVFAWRSEMEIARICVDYRIKSKRSVTIGETFGKLLCRFEDRKMVVGGFSLGAQVILTALTNPELHGQNDQLGKYRVAFFAPALNSLFVQSDFFTYPQNPIVHQSEFFLNKGDCAVKVSKFIAQRRAESICSVRDLLSFEPIPGHSIAVRDITGEINKRHSIVNYCQSSELTVKLAEMLNATLADNCAFPKSSVPVAKSETRQPEVESDENKIVVETEE